MKYRHRRRRATDANHDRWLVSYADFITLLFAFFVVMFASSQVDKRKAGHLALAITVAFQTLGMFTPTAAAATSVRTPEPFANAQMIENQVHTEELGRIVPAKPKDLAPVQPATLSAQVLEQLRIALAPEVKRNEVAFRMTREGLVVSLQEIGFFDSGSAQLKPGAVDKVAKIAEAIRPLGQDVRIEGDTDNIPIHNSAFQSNWELSTARATEIVNLFINRFSFSPSRLSAAGYAEFHPVASNATADGRAKNRRVDIVIVAPSATSSSGEKQTGRAQAAPIAKSILGGTGSAGALAVVALNKPRSTKEFR
jgi:chemotaxis protein MotB